ncbi:uncharacterized protein PG998_006445 [Apiospora kogelbergensis]|uniref:uncharacterized protein n=1 Tax=Apiospora kogelbergensis TaxID=1337665 RepID=UPI00312FB301
MSDESTAPSNMEGNEWVLTAKQLEYARSCKLVSRLPEITNDELADKGKGDYIAKVLAIVQVLWLILQLSVRAGAKKSSSPLEIATLAFALLASITYIILFDHPQDITTPIRIHISRLPTITEFRRIDRLSPLRVWETGAEHSHFLPNNVVHMTRDGEDYSSYVFIAGLSIGSFIFGCTHLLGWNYEYPNGVERILWITSSLITALFPAGLIYGLMAMSVVYIGDKNLSEFKPVGLIYITLWMVYFLARIFLLVEMFRSLYFLPPDAFLSTWAKNWPHIGNNVRKRASVEESIEKPDEMPLSQTIVAQQRAATPDLQAGDQEDGHTELAVEHELLHRVESHAPHDVLVRGIEGRGDQALD